MLQTEGEDTGNNNPANLLNECKFTIHLLLEVVNTTKRWNVNFGPILGWIPGHMIVVENKSNRSKNKHSNYKINNK